MAREGKTVDIPKRKVNVSAFDITAIDGLNIHFRIACSKGTYIRSIAHDFGAALNSGAHLTSLRRTKIGDFNVDNAQDPLEFADMLLGPDNNS